MFDDKNWFTAIVGLILICSVLALGDRLTATSYSSIGIIRDSDYDPPTSACGKNGCSSTDEQCEVYLIGDEFTGWANVSCALYFSPLYLEERVNVQWVEGGIIGFRWSTWVTRK